MSHIAKGTFTVDIRPLGFEDAPAGSQLGRMTINKVITGDLQATTVGQMLSAMTVVKGSAGYVALEVVTGTLHGRTGSFAMMHTGVMDRGAPSLAIRIVPDSGTGELAGISGEFRLEVVEKVHHYTLTYELPIAPA